MEGQIRAARNEQTRPHPIYIAFDEWNTWYRARSGTTEFEIAKTGLEEHYNFEDALATGMFLNSFIRHANIVKMANLAQLVNVIAPIFTSKQGMYLQTIYFPLMEYGKQRGNTSLDVQVTSPTYRVGNRAPLGYLDVSSTYNAARSRGVSERAESQREAGYFARAWITSPDRSRKEAGGLGDEPHGPEGGERFRQREGEARDPDGHSGAGQQRLHLRVSQALAHVLRLKLQ